MADTTTRDKLMDLAERRIQTVGFNAFSYHDLAAEVGIKTASIHYYFPSKADLAQAVVSRYRQRFNLQLAAISDSRRASPGKLQDFMELFQKPLDSGKAICLCGMLASDYEAIPEVVQGEVRRFFSDVEAWLVGVLRQAKAAGELDFRGKPEAVAVGIVAALEGALLSARTFRQPERFLTSIRWILDSLQSA
jgi:TetR/AcrR family transcriptional repressor of nem operon